MHSVCSALWRGLFILFLERATNMLEFRENLYPSWSLVLIETSTLLCTWGLNIGPSPAKCAAFHTPLATHLCSPPRLFVRPYLTLPLSILTLSTQYDVNIHVAPTGVLFPRRLPPPTCYCHTFFVIAARMQIVIQGILWILKRSLVVVDAVAVRKKGALE